MKWAPTTVGTPCLGVLSNLTARGPQERGSGAGWHVPSLTQQKVLLSMNQTWASQINKLTWVVFGPEQVNRAQRKKRGIAAEANWWARGESTSHVKGAADERP